MVLMTSENWLMMLSHEDTQSLKVEVFSMLLVKSSKKHINFDLMVKLLDQSDD